MKLKANGIANGATTDENDCCWFLEGTQRNFSTTHPKRYPTEETSSVTEIRMEENHQGDVMLRKCVAKGGGVVQGNGKGEE